MTNYTIYNETNAPEDARETLEGVKKGVGFVPNLMGTMAEAPSLLKAYLQLSDFLEKTSLTPIEQRLLTLAISTENACAYCVAAEGMLAHKVAKAPIEHVEAVREGRVLSDVKLDAFVNFAREIVSSRGWPSKDATDAFFAAGYTKQNVLEVILGASLKTISNYTNHIASTPIDAAFVDYAPKAADAA